MELLLRPARITFITEKLYLYFFSSVNLVNGMYFVISTSSFYNHVLIWDQQFSSVISVFPGRTHRAAVPVSAPVMACSRGLQGTGSFLAGIFHRFEGNSAQYFVQAYWVENKGPPIYQRTTLLLTRGLSESLLYRALYKAPRRKWLMKTKEHLKNKRQVPPWAI